MSLLCSDRSDTEMLRYIEVLMKPLSISIISHLLACRGIRHGASARDALPHLRISRPPLMNMLPSLDSDHV